MKRILIAQVARLDRERRMARQGQRPQLALPVPGRDSPYGPSGSTALEACALSSLMLAKAYSR
ncbi:MAG TPA: hypothetical protein VFE23_05155 [Usitatibacter sp.]|jgi:hypothetical protein|nr:hypothetical protein [Usitatibacter sp.]